MTKKEAYLRYLEHYTDGEAGWKDNGVFVTTFPNGERKELDPALITNDNAELEVSRFIGGEWEDYIILPNGLGDVYVYNTMLPLVDTEGTWITGNLARTNPFDAYVANALGLPEGTTFMYSRTNAEGSL